GVLGFDSLAGQSAAAARLTGMMSRARLPHALIFCGPDGSGKLRTTLLLAQMLMCEERRPAQATACDRCPGCTQGKESVRADIHTIGAGTTDRLLKIEAVREAMRTLQLRPMEGRAKVLIIDRAECLTLQS